MEHKFARYDAVIVGSGPNGLSAGIVLAAAGLRTLILERAPTIGGGTRTLELTEPGFRHDVCSAIHPLAAGSPFFRSLPLERYGLEWIHPEIPLAQPLEGDRAVALRRTVIGTAAGLGADRSAYLRVYRPLVRDANRLLPGVMGPIRPRALSLPLVRFGLPALRSAEGFARERFSGAPARALFAGVAAHSFLRLDQPGSAAFGLLLIVAGHAYGWPFPRGGCQAIADALAGYFRDLGGEIATGIDVRSFVDLPHTRAYLFDTTPRQVLEIAGERIDGLYRRQLERYRHGPGIFKVDYALSAPIPWAADECRRAGTVHVGGTFEEVAHAEMAVLEGCHAERPFVLVAQQSLFDDTRAPAGKHVAWAYCHVPHGSDVDMTARIERQIERFAPGFKDVILARHTFTARQMEQYNPNYIGGDISSGSNDLYQVVARPALKWDPYRTSDPAIFICSAATPPGGGVHGMAGYHAARSALRLLGSA